MAQFNASFQLFHSFATSTKKQQALEQHDINVSFQGKAIQQSIDLEASKSECNRALIMQALSGGKIALSNISQARDSQTMLRLLAADDTVLDVLDAGTTMRFLTAFCTVTERKVTLTGTPRMQQRPIKLLVEALTQLGGSIQYEKEAGYPPITIASFQQKTAALSIPGNISSQYISALLMIAPMLHDGLSLKLTGAIISKPYIAMTLGLMQRFGVEHQWEGNVITIAPQQYQAAAYTIEGDWSGASYWFSMAAIAEEADIFLNTLKENSFQGDQAIVEIMDALGVQAAFNQEGVRLTKKQHTAQFEYDFTKCPDLAQTVAVTCAAKGIDAYLTGLQSLRIKETDRIAALQAELAKIGIEVIVEGDEAIRIPASKVKVDNVAFHTYEDHRMAMAFAPLALLGNISFDDKTVVNKSYPSFWQHLEDAGFQIS